MKKVAIYICFLFLFTNYGLSQITQTQEVKVVKPYEPVISDAFKINELPQITDTIKIKPKFTYSITPIQYNTSFYPKTIKPAKLKKEMLSKLYYGYTRLGFGSYLTPLAEVAVNSKRSERWQWSSMLHYQSSNGKIKNQQKKRVYAGVSNFFTDANAKHFFKNNTVANLSLNYKNNISYFYGYNPNYLSDSIEAPLKKKDIEKQKLNTLKIEAGYGTQYLDSSEINYNIKISNLFTNTIDKNTENIFNLGTSMSYFFKREIIGLDIDIKNYNDKGFLNKADYNIIKFNPWVGAFGKKWRIIAGVNTAFKADESKYKFYPKLSMHYNIIDYFLIPYFELSGNYIVNNFTKLYHENNFIRNDLSVKPTNNKINITFGFRGNISSEIAFNIKVDYRKFQDQYFYVNDTSVRYHNKFNVVYDNLTQTRFLGEISYKKAEKFYIALKGNFYKNTLDKQQYAWHMPDYKISLHTRYSIQNKIIANVNVFAISKRYALEYDKTNKPKAVELKGTIDLNLGLEYRYTKILSAFLNINNIAAIKYYKWNNYPTQQFNIMGGITYLF